MILVNEEKLLAAEEEAKGQGSKVYFHKLKAIGVTRCQLSVKGGHRTFTFESGQVLHLKGSDNLPAGIASELNVSVLPTLITQWLQTPVNQKSFLTELAEAGVHELIADLEGMEIICKATNDRDFYAQNIPDPH